MKQKSLGCSTPCYEVSAGTANLLQAYHEAKAIVQQTVIFATAYQRANIKSYKGKTFLLKQLEDSAKAFIDSLQLIVLENIGNEINNGERYV